MGSPLGPGQLYSPAAWHRATSVPPTADVSGMRRDPAAGGAQEVEHTSEERGRIRSSRHPELGDDMDNIMASP